MFDLVVKLPVLGVRWVEQRKVLAWFLVIALKKAVSISLSLQLLPRREDVWFSQAKDVPKYRGLLYLQSQVLQFSVHGQ